MFLFQDGHGGLLAAGEKKRKRTSIAAPEKRSLEAYFAVQVSLGFSKVDIAHLFTMVWHCVVQQY